MEYTHINTIMTLKSTITVRIKLLKAWHDVIDFEFIIYLMIFWFCFYLSLFHALYYMSILVWYLLHCTWLKCIRSYTKYPSHEFHVNKWLVHNHESRQPIRGCSAPPPNLRDDGSWLLGYVSYGQCTSVYTYTLDKTYGKSWLKVIK